MSMGFILFVLAGALEITLVILTFHKAAGRKTWRKNRLSVRIAEIVTVVVALLLPLGQKWRLVPVLLSLSILALIAVLMVLIGRKKPEREMRRSKAVFSCILSVLLIGLSLVPAFLFTGYNGLATSGGYAVKESSVILTDSKRTDPFEQDGSSREVPVHFYYPETDPNSEERFPLVVFSHGAFGYYQSNTSTYMELASSGYVVAALDHPHHAFFTQDTDGKTVLVDMDFMGTALTLTDETDPVEQYALYTQWMDLRTADMNLVLDEIETAVRAEAINENWFLSGSSAETVLSVLKKTDITRIGLMGHSMGGATAVELGRERDDISAVIDIDGTMLSEYTGVENGKLTVRTETYPVPVLEFNNWESYNDRREYLAQGGCYPNEELIAGAAAGFTTTIHDTEHMDFTDLPLLSPFLGKLLGSGTRDTKETMTIVNSLVLSFLNSYLKGEGVFTIKEIY